MDLPRLTINGRPPTTAMADLAALNSYGHFTAMQVRNRATRGLDLHLARLDAAHRELFGQPLDGAQLRAYVRDALADDVVDASVRVIVSESAVLVLVREPGEMPDTPQRLRAVPFQRPVAHIKHSSGFAQEYYRRQAQHDGYDEILLTAPDGTVSEGGITNLGCWDGTTMYWPDAPHLAGITMQLLRRAGVPSRSAPIRVADLASFAGVFVTNARGIAPVEQVDDTPLPLAPEAFKLLTETYESIAWDVL